MSRVARTWVVALALLLGAALLSACGLADSADSAHGQAIAVVAAENFWGSVAAQVGGARVAVTSVIRNPDTDPHSYEPAAQDARDFAGARYVILNGAGYDSWAERLLTANPVSGRVVLNIGDFLGRHAGDNPHLWYNPDYVARVVARMRDDLKTLDPAASAALDQSAQAYLTTGLAQYHQLIATIKARYSGAPVGATESIFAYLAPALGLKLTTPYSYMKAVAGGQDIAAADEATVERQITRKQIRVLVYNSQNTPPNVQTLISLAQAHGIPVATITETLTPPGATFQAWQAAQLQGILDALDQAGA